MVYKNQLNNRIFERIAFIPDVTKGTFYQLAYIFECYSAIKLSEQYNTEFLMYDDIDPVFKEDHRLSRNDTGIDLCNKLDMIVQVKLRTYNLTWRELSTFVASKIAYNSETDEEYIRWKKAILIRNSSSTLSKPLIEHLNFKKFIDIPVDMIDFFQYCNHLKENPPPPMIDNIPDDFKERYYQTEAIQIIQTNKNKNVYMSIPTGAGKNYIIIQSFVENEKYIIFVPKCILIDQLKDEIIKFKPMLKNKIQCIGDNNKSIFNDKKLITICVYNSIAKVGNLNNFHKVFIDEAHHIYKPYIYYQEDEEYDEKVDNEETYIQILRNHIQNKTNSILLSATLDKPINEEDNIYYHIDLRDLIEQKILCDYQIKIPVFEEVNDTTVCNYLLENYSHLIIYSSSTMDGKKINKIMNKLLLNSSAYIDCHTSKNKREIILQKFREGKLLYLVNVRVLIEGFNATITQGCVLMHISKNDKTLIQILGRTLRPHPNKTYAYLILPFTDPNERKDFQFICKVLYDNDSIIRQTIINKKYGGYIDVIKIEKDKQLNEDDDDIDEEIMDTKFEIVLDSIGKCISGRYELWKLNLEKLKLFLNENKRKPSRNKNENVIYSWLFHQVGNYKNKTHIMKDDKIYKEFTNFKNDEKYKEYLFSFEDVWKLNLEKLKEFLNENKRRPLIKNKNEKSLCCWLYTQVKSCKNRKYILKDDVIFQEWQNFQNNEKYKQYIFSSNLSNKEIWNENLEKLKSFLNENKRRPRITVKNEKSIIMWLSYQIKSSKNKTNIMKDDIIFQEWQNFKNDEKYKQYFT